LIKYDVDIIGFQEVRTREKNSTLANQLPQLQAYVGKDKYPYLHYTPASPVTGGEGIEEGIGILRSVLSSPDLHWR